MKKKNIKKALCLAMCGTLSLGSVVSQIPEIGFVNVKAATVSGNSSYIEDGSYISVNWSIKNNILVVNAYSTGNGSDYCLDLSKLKADWENSADWKNVDTVAINGCKSVSSVGAVFGSLTNIVLGKNVCYLEPFALSKAEKIKNIYYLNDAAGCGSPKTLEYKTLGGNYYENLTIYGSNYQVESLKNEIDKESGITFDYISSPFTTISYDGVINVNRYNFIENSHIKVQFINPEKYFFTDGGETTAVDITDAWLDSNGSVSLQTPISNKDLKAYSVADYTVKMSIPLYGKAVVPMKVYMVKDRIYDYLKEGKWDEGKYKVKDEELIITAGKWDEDSFSEGGAITESPYLDEIDKSAITKITVIGATSLPSNAFGGMTNVVRGVFLPEELVETSEGLFAGTKINSIHKYNDTIITDDSFVNYLGNKNDVEIEEIIKEETAEESIDENVTDEKNDENINETESEKETIEEETTVCTLPEQQQVAIEKIVNCFENKDESSKLTVEDYYNAGITERFPDGSLKVEACLDQLNTVIANTKKNNNSTLTDYYEKISKIANNSLKYVSSDISNKLTDDIIKVQSMDESERTEEIVKELCKKIMIVYEDNEYFKYSNMDRYFDKIMDSEIKNLIGIPKIFEKVNYDLGETVGPAETTTEQESTQEETSEEKEIITEETSSEKESVQEEETTGPVQEQESTTGEETEQEKPTEESSKEESTDIKTKDMIINEDSVTLDKGKKVVLSTVQLPLNTTEVPKWSSSNNKIAKVDKDGKVTAVAGGQCYIYAKTSDITVKCKIKVLQKPTSIKLDKKKLTIKVEKTAKLKYILPKYSSKVKISWVSSNKKIATVSSGKIKALKKGKVKITVKTSNGKKAVCTVTVK